MLSRSDRFKQALSRLDPDGDPADALENGLHVEEPGQSFAERTLAHLELLPKSSHILTGPRGTGKSTQLRILHQKLSENEHLLPIYIDAETATGDLQRPGTLPGLIMTAIHDPNIAKRGNLSNTPIDPAPLAAIASGKLALGFLNLRARIPGRRKLVLILDLQDRLPDERFSALFGGDLAKLMTFFPVIVGAHQSALHGPTRNRVDGFDSCSRQPTHDPAQGGTMHAFLMQILSQRADDLIPADCCTRLVAASGGAPRDLIHLAKLALVQAYVAGYNRVEPDDVTHAITEFGQKHLAGLDNHDLDRLHRLRKTGTFAPADNRDINLLATRRVLEYTSPIGPSTFAVHPTLLPLLAPSDPLEDL